MQTENQTAAHALLKAPAGREHSSVLTNLSLSPVHRRAHTHTPITLDLKYIRCTVWSFATQIHNIVIGEDDRTADRQETMAFFDLQRVPLEQCCLL